MKKILVYVITVWIIGSLIGPFCVCKWQLSLFWWRGSSTLSTDMTYIQGHEEPDITKTDLWDKVSIKWNDNNDTIIMRLLAEFSLSDNLNDDHAFLNYASAIINIALSLVAFIALIMTIYTFYMMFFTENEAWIKKAKWNLVGIFIALGILWLAWIIVSFIFRWYQSNWQSRNTNDTIEPESLTMVNHESNDRIYFTM